MIVLIIGDSGVGKSTIVKELKNRMENVNIIKSYTTRPKRNLFDDDHIFIKSKKDIDDKIIASTIIDDEFYCSTENQFKDDEINVYIVDDKGLLDIKNFFIDEDILSIHINRNDVEIPIVRKNRNIKKFGLEYDFEIFNDGNIDETVDEVIECIKNYRKKD